MEKTRFGLRTFAALALAFGLGATANGVAGATTSRESPYFVLDQLARVLVHIENDYVDPVDRSRLIEGAIKGMVAELDPHSSFLPRGDYSIFRGDTEGRFGGVGVEVDFARDKVTIMSVVEGSPAAKAGILPGDEIVSISGQPVRGKSPLELVRRMRGEPGSKVDVTLRREDNEGFINVSLTRQIINVSSVAHKLLAESVGYIRIKTFQTGTHRELLEAAGSLVQQSNNSLQGVVLDLRNNPGGLVDEATAVADEFLEGGIIFTTRHRGKIVDSVAASSGGALKRGPVAVLVNEYSASAAELLAGAVQDQHRGPIVGARTFGKGSVQSIVDLPRGDGLKLTTMRYYTPNGRAIQALGISPDILVPSAREPFETALREVDLAGHLAPEAEETSERSATTTVAESELPVDREATRLGVALVIPDNPLNGPDRALKVAYEWLTGRGHR